MGFAKSTWRTLLRAPAVRYVSRYRRRPGVVLAAVVVGFAGYWLVQQTQAASLNADTAYTSVVVGGNVPRDDLRNPAKKEIAMQLVSSAENSTLEWRQQYGYIEDIGDGRGYTAGLIGFCSGTGDMLKLVEYYKQLRPGNALEPYLPALRQVNGTASHDGLGKPFELAWRQAAADPSFRQAQEAQRDRLYFAPAVQQARQDGLSLLGQFMYYDAAVMHGPNAWGGGLLDIRRAAMAAAKPPAEGGDEAVYLNTFLDKRTIEMKKEPKHRNLSRLEGVQRKFLKDKNFSLTTPLTWTIYGDTFSVTTSKT